MTPRRFRVGPLLALLCLLVPPRRTSGQDDLLDRRTPPPAPVGVSRTPATPLEDSVRIARLRAMLADLRKRGGPAVTFNRMGDRFIFFLGHSQELWLEKSEFRQGDRVWLRLFAKNPLENPRLRFASLTYTLYQTSARKDRVGYQSFLAVPMDADTGVTDVVISYGPRARPETSRLPIRIVAGVFAGKTRHIKDVEMSQELRQELVDEHWFFDSTLAVGTRLMPDSIFSWPASGAYTSEYGVMTEFDSLKKAWRHKAIDIGNEEGTPVYAAADGIIAGVANLEGHGNSVVIAHGAGVHTGYLHLRDVTAAEGGFVRRGQQIGVMGRTGVATGANLHFEIWVRGKAVNPLSFLPAGDSVELKAWLDRRRLNR